MQHFGPELSATMTAANKEGRPIGMSGHTLKDHHATPGAITVAATPTAGHGAARISKFPYIIVAATMTTANVAARVV